MQKSWHLKMDLGDLLKLFRAVNVVRNSKDRVYIQSLRVLVREDWQSFFVYIADIYDLIDLRNVCDKIVIGGVVETTVPYNISLKTIKKITRLCEEWEQRFPSGIDLGEESFIFEVWRLGNGEVEVGQREFF